MTDTTTADSYQTAPEQPLRWVAYHIPFPARPAESSLETNLSESPIMSSSSSITPTSPTISEIEQLTLDSQPEQDMADCLRNDTLAIESWERLQTDLQIARNLEAMAREQRRSVGLQWQRFKYRRFDKKIQRVVDRERIRQAPLNEEARQSQSPLPLVVRNLTPPLNATLPGHCLTTPLTETDPNVTHEPEEDGSAENPYTVANNSEEDFRQIVEAYEQTPVGIQERQDYENRQ